ncbi:MAG: hypothetical protein Q7S58_05115 [Candidatus Binatus sp.]|uniref:hypothetical protein n=1 Tax=Candidatus Binatus sp. TaxID=2811406 RepID=UPI00271667FA|nr:hypothetical protein [Candidatus Binatus sp.]MDO8431773.1 hypothetical protein [Candidatus Binatus sp.]
MSTNLTEADRKMCASMGIDERTFLAQKRGGLSLSHAPSHSTSARSQRTAVSSSGSAGLMRAHDEVDRAHDVLSSQQKGSYSSWAKVPIQEHVAAAIAGLKAFDPSAKDGYDTLLVGVMHAMRALELSAPAYADTKPLPGEKVE